MTVPKHDTGVCIVCLRRHSSVGYAPSKYERIGWACMECLNLAPGIAVVKKVYHMTQKQLDPYEEKGIEEGGDEAGAYLDSIGKTDLADLEKHEWLEVGRRWLLGYEKSVQKSWSALVAPF